VTWDAIVVGSGFGGAMAAHELVHAGHRVLMLERGGWVARGPDNWGARGAGLVTPHYTMESPYRVDAGGRRYEAGSWQCVGGQSVFYGGASFRFRERDFEPDAGIVGESGAEWPFRYADLEPYYARAEQLLGVAGEPGDDPTEPPRSTPYPQPPAPLSRSASAIADAARRLGMTPSRIPLAIAYRAAEGRRACIRCGTCDGYACAAEAKNDLATTIIPDLVRQGMTLRPNTVCVRLVRDGSRVTAVEYVDRVTGQRGCLSARCVVLAAGALATPHLLLASRLETVNRAGHAVGRYLTRHLNAVVFGLYPSEPNPERDFDKQVAIHDFYFGVPGSDAPSGTLGGIQQMTPPLGLVRAYLPRAVRDPGALFVAHASGLLAIAEDQPRLENGVSVDRSSADRFGLPRLRVRHAYSPRDEAAAAALVGQAKRVLREAGARLTWVHRIDTFSHALGTVRMGVDDATSPLDAHGRFGGVDNLYVADGSALPRAAGVNPSLTIAANALRIGAHVARQLVPQGGCRVRRPLPVQQPPSPLEVA
jgi:choline dehydrogenase-like flavoprotein